MRLPTNNGPTIGFLRHGTPVSLIQCDGGRALADARFPRARNTGVLQPGAVIDDVIPVAVDLHVPRRAIPEETATGAGTSDVRYGLYREISATGNGPGFAFVKCGRLRVLDVRGRRMRVPAEFEAGELHGWVDAAAPGASRSGSTPVLASTTAEASPVERSYSIDGAFITLGPPSLWRKDGMMTIGSVDTYLIATTTGDALVVLEPGHHEENDPPIAAYRVSAGEHWFLSEAACDRNTSDPATSV